MTKKLPKIGLVTYVYSRSVFELELRSMIDLLWSLSKRSLNDYVILLDKESTDTYF